MYKFLYKESLYSKIPAVTRPQDMPINTPRVFTGNDSGYDADDASDSPTISNAPLLLDDGNFFLSLAAPALLATTGDSSTDFDDCPKAHPCDT